MIPTYFYTYLANLRLIPANLTCMLAVCFARGVPFIRHVQ